MAGRATDAGYFKFCYATGSLLVVIGIFMISLCSEYWQFFLAQGVCQGIGTGFIFIPTLTILPGYFDRHRLFASR
jgi:MFS family permease